MRRALAALSIVLLCLVTVAEARDGFMHEAERRAQRTALAERGHSESVPARQGAASDSTYAGEEPGTIVIETGKRMLHLVQEGGRTISYPVAVGREGAQWTGVTNVVGKRKNPEWRPTPNMRRRDPSLPAVVAPGPSNPMGTRAIYLAEGYLRIHGTNNPHSIGSAASSGCFRMHNEDVSDLYERVSTGARVIVLH